MYQFIPLHPCDYLKKISIKINLATEEGKSRNEIWQWTNDEIRVAVQSWLWVRIELKAWWRPGDQGGGGPAAPSNFLTTIFFIINNNKKKLKNLQF